MDNGTADYYPSAKDGYVIWQKATRQYSESDTLASVAKDTEIYAAKFNGTSFDTPTRITNNSVMDTQPHIAVNGNKAFAVWTQNTDNNILADADNVVTASDAAFVLQKTLVSTFELPIQKKTDDWLKYADVDCDDNITASDAAFILQKTLVSTFELPAEKKYE